MPLAERMHEYASSLDPFFDRPLSQPYGVADKTDKIVEAAPVYVIRWYDPSLNLSGQTSPTTVDPAATCKQGAEDAMAVLQKWKPDVIFWIATEEKNEGRIIKP
jgi:hypothetical protein